MQRLRTVAGLLAGLPFAIIYGLTARMAFAADEFPGYFSTMSVAFLFLVPLVVGALTVWLAPAPQRQSWTYALLMPLAACALAALVAGAFAWEALICIVMALPILAIMGSAGGALACLLARTRARAAQSAGNTTIIGALLLVPYLGGLVEQRVPTRPLTVTTETQIVIQADAETVWRNITRVPRIQQDERAFSLLFDVLGAPRPLEAMLEAEGAGGLRRGMFEHNLVFDETITGWEPGRRISWAIAVGDRAAVPAPWREIGGQYFDVTGASYRIEPRPDGSVVLHLDSTCRLTTHFNGYGAIWARWGLGQFQDEVLRVIRSRAEAEAALAGRSALGIEP